MTTLCSQANKETNGVREEDDECVSNQSEDHRLWVAEEHQNVEQEIALGKRGIVNQHDPRHVDVLVKDLGLEYGNSVQTPASIDVTEE